MGYIKSFNEFVNESSDNMHFVLSYITHDDRFHVNKQQIKKDEVRLYASMVDEDDTISRAFITLGNTPIWSKSWDSRTDRDKIRVFLDTYPHQK